MFNDNNLGIDTDIPQDIIDLYSKLIREEVDRDIIAKVVRAAEDEQKKILKRK